MEFRYIQRWERPDCYIGAEYPEYYVVIARTGQSGALEQSNFETAYESLAPLGGVLIQTSKHWACGFIDLLLVHEDHEQTLYAADDLLRALEDYPVLDEEDFYNREQEEADESWQWYSERERLQHAREYGKYWGIEGIEQWLKIIRRGEYYPGHPSDIVGG